MTTLLENVISLHHPQDTPTTATALKRVTLAAISADGQLTVRDAAEREVPCDWLDTGAYPNPPLAIGDTLLALLGAPGDPGLVLGRCSRYQPETPPRHVTLAASETITLQCGESTVDLRADGKVMVRGEDVLLRAKGTQRIRAGTVSIN